ncbi:selenocysteine-specific translation elongation factor [Vagococcus sp. BWB3-3]|uniref:Selenocysteine-specific elongation factor n=1 Tax=Vagococcus allomyrinae TaxID=2794353 RepID=A0A940SXC8_9ENTE|nr:selenocysteine-specific translation elongation factor [Vagococcus allomyrinae]MBP1044190.1 selenocysteine-specific translation elongation factor [Vagococcus allomyrinae]
MSNQHIVIGTAGHIDHGKTTLIKGLTGIETDTTAEEKRRGVSINLGFAYLDLPDGQRIGIVDVPGHERFVKNMLAGVAGINLVLLVIDANEGIMPQTREHLDILQLLGVKDFIVVLTKVGTVEEDLRQLVVEDIRETLSHTALADAPLIETDAVLGIGMAALKSEIYRRVTSIEKSLNESEPRLNIDRVFSVKGHGTIVTGTLIDGSLKVGADLVVYPSAKKTKIRSIQVHESAQEEAFAGQRTALNLTKLSLGDLKRGDVITVKNNVTPTWMIDVKLRALPSAERPLGLWNRVHIHLGTKEVLGRVVPLGAADIPPGGEGYVQLRLEEQVAVKQGDHLILRSYSPTVTIAGGIVLEANAEKHRRYNQDILESLHVKESGDFNLVLLDYLNKQAGFVTAKTMADYLNTSSLKINQSLETLLAKKKVVQVNQTFISSCQLKEISSAIYELLQDYHQKFPLRSGMSLEEVRSRFELRQREVEAILLLLEGQGVVKRSQGSIKLASFSVIFSAEQQAIKKRIETTLLEAGLAPPSLAELLANDPAATAVLETLVGDSVYYLNQETVIHMTVYHSALAQVQSFLAAHGTMTLGEFRDMMHTSRKYSKMFLEHLDELNVTKRLEDSRVLVEYEGLSMRKVME